ncbi:MAG: hypothetical protein IJ753_00005 [Bacteroidales bacterium]|nr:hypothetical protein [Bacteroidales bacterium]
MPKKKSKQKYKPLSDATPEEIQEAMQMGSYWLTDELEGHTESGAFAVPFLPEPAIEFFPKRAYLTLSSPDCKWKWKEGTKLSTLFINVMRSDMAHKLREFINQDKPNVAVGSSFERDDASEDGFDDANEVLEIDPEDRRNGFSVKPEMELLEELEREEGIRDKGLKIARAAAKASGDEMLVKYVELAFSLPDYRAISKKLKITQAEVRELEARLIAILSTK